MDASLRASLHGLAGLPAVAAADKIGRGMHAMFAGGLPQLALAHGKTSSPGTPPGTPSPPPANAWRTCCPI